MYTNYQIYKKKLIFKFLFIIKKTFKVICLQYLFNIYILIETTFYLEYNFSLKIGKKTCNFKGLEKIIKPRSF